MKKQSFHMLTRLIAGVAAALIMLAATVMISEKTNTSHGLFYNASGLDPDCVVLTVDGTPITAEEYLYWISYYCDYYGSYMSYMGITDLNQTINDGAMTAGEYISQQAQEQALSMVVQYVVVDNWAAELGITLTDEDQASIAGQHGTMVENLGSEDAYTAWLAAMGIRESFLNDTLIHSFMIDHVFSAYCDADGAHRLSDAELQAVADERHLVNAKILAFDATEASEEGDETDVENANAQVYDTYNRILWADNSSAELDAVAEEMEQSAEATVRDCSGDDVLSVALRNLSNGSLSEVIEDTENNIYYIAIRVDMDMDTIASTLLNEEFAARCAAANVIPTDAFYTIDPVVFYSKLYAAQMAIANNGAAAAE